MIAIIVLNYKTWQDTILCVESIRKTTKCPYKIYVIDNDSPNESFYKLKSAFSSDDDVMIVKSQENKGYSAGNNIGIKLALNDGADAVILSNSDVIYFENSIDTMHRFIKNNKQVGIVGPKVLLPDGSIQHFIRKNYDFKNYILTKKPLINIRLFGVREKVLFENYNYNDTLSFYGVLSGCCLLLTKEYLETCGLLDENVFLYYEESIISHKAKKANLLTHFLPEAEILHKSSVSIGNQNSAFSRYHRYYSSLYMLRNYVRVNNFQLTIAIFINYTPFLVNSCFKKEYRRMLGEFTKKCLSLYRPKRLNTQSRSD
ncbi:glycosyltransferase family 2 protein [Neobacillus rhizophilus]|uniref:Glycosyltransferase family 2 protein n=1 Tax=Neobacillus rhizophilus TaxID=2833579 RepID=A0A942YWH2_9BACI|nr:glycosyltransferase family 2 protein [Neobacillus rhizophilus]MBS4212686.1 glycosyltransferase family 2 protein [Neobacillus rhizophilus]